jgi:NAD(P)H-flavin reductase
MFEFAPGQWVELTCVADNLAVCRPYSIASASERHSDCFEVAVSAGRAQESRPALFDAERGTCVRLDGPYGPAIRHVAARPALLVSAGTGVSPMRAILQDALQKLGSIFRINRYTRVSHDKRPLKDYLDCWFWEGERRRTCTGFFVRISPDFLGIGVGCHGFARRGRLDEFRRAAGHLVQLSRHRSV